MTRPTDLTLAKMAMRVTPDDSSYIRAMAEELIERRAAEAAPQVNWKATAEDALAKVTVLEKDAQARDDELAEEKQLHNKWRATAENWEHEYKQLADEHNKSKRDTARDASNKIRDELRATVQQYERVVAELDTATEARKTLSRELAKCRNQISDACNALGCVACDSHVETAKRIVAERDEAIKQRDEARNELVEANRRIAGAAAGATGGDFSGRATSSAGITGLTPLGGDFVTWTDLRRVIANVNLPTTLDAIDFEIERRSAK